MEWNSEAGRVRGVIVKKMTSDVRVKGYAHHASKDEPQYIIKSEKTDHVAIHKGQAFGTCKRSDEEKVAEAESRQDEVGVKEDSLCPMEGKDQVTGL